MKTMERNHEVTTVQMLPDGMSELTEPGWSRHMLQKYDRRIISSR